MRPSLACLNTAYFSAETRYVGVFRDRELGIADEADLLEDHLRKQVTVEIASRDQAQLDLPRPPPDGPLTREGLAWMGTAQDGVEARRSFACRRRGTPSPSRSRAGSASSTRWPRRSGRFCCCPIRTSGSW